MTAPAGVVTAGAVARCRVRAAGGLTGGDSAAIRAYRPNPPVVVRSSPLCGSLLVVTAVSPDWDLLDRLDAAATDARLVHHDLCAQFDERGPQPCSCGIPALLTDAARFVRSLAVESVVSRAQRAA